MTGKKFILNINMISIAIGAILFFTRIRLPELITNTISSVGNMIGPASMIVTGMLFAGMDLKAIFANKRVYFISALRMLVIPLIALFLIKSQPSCHTVCRCSKDHAHCISRSNHPISIHRYTDVPGVRKRCTLCQRD